MHRLLVLAPLLVLLGGCSDGPTPDEAGKELRTQVGQVHDQLLEGVEPLQAWKVSDDASSDSQVGCGEDKVRRAYAATVDVPDSQQPDAATYALQLVGRLGQAHWDAGTPEGSGSAGVVKATRSSQAGAGSSLTLRFTAVDGGWHYELTARSGCVGE